MLSNIKVHSVSKNNTSIIIQRYKISQMNSKPAQYTLSNIPTHSVVLKQAKKLVRHIYSYQMMDRYSKFILRNISRCKSIRVY